jgi:type I restriction enzyme S subunit
MKAWPVVSLGSVLRTHIDAVPSAQLGNVNLAGVYGFGRGLFKRGPISPSETTYKSFHRLNAGDFVISSPKAWEGAVARVSEGFDGWFLSPVFPTFRSDTDKLDTRFLDWYCKRDAVWRQLQAKAKGMGARRESVSPGQFLSIEIPLPPMAEQLAIVARLDALADKTRDVEAHLDAAERDAEHLLALRFRDVITGAPLRPMAEVAPLVRREQPIDLDGSYPELGIRSFGKGAFHKPPLSGSDVGTKRLYRIEQGDLLFSNVFAWEGAIAIAQSADAGRFGSHRFITCRAVPGLVTAEFLRYYFLTDEGMLKIGEASPGGAGRNRTLGLEKLMAIEVPVPHVLAQQTFDRLQADVAALKARHTAIRQANAMLIPATLEHIFSSEARAHA